MASRNYFCVSLSFPVLVGLCDIQTSAADWPMSGRDGTRNAVSPEKNPPLDWSIGGWDRMTERWNLEKARNINWRARLGYYTFGSPIVAGGKVYIGTTGSGGHVKRLRGNQQYGYLHCFRATDGKFLWQYSAKELEKYGWHWSRRGLGSSPLVEGNRLWFVSNRWEVVCLDTDGFHDNEDDGPIKAERRRLFNVVHRALFSGSNGKDPLHDTLEALKREQVTIWLQRRFNQAGIQLPQDAKVETEKDGEHWTITARVRGERVRFEVRLETKDESHPWLAIYKNASTADKEEADIVWRYDLRKELKVHPFSHIHWNPNRQCSPASYGDRLYVVTGNGTEQRSNKIPSPKAPSLVCFDKRTGKVLWTDSSPGGNILRGQFSSPLVVEINGKAQVIVGQGDGWVRSFDALTGKLIWKFDINAKESRWGWSGGTQGKRNSILATPVFYKGRIFIASGQIAEFAGGAGRLVCIDPTRTGDISSELAVDAKGRALPHRRFQAVVRKNGEKAIPNPNSALIWEFTGSDQNKNGKEDFGDVFLRTLSSVVVKNDVLIAVDSEGAVHCFHSGTGKRYWVYDLFASVVGSPLIVDDWVYVPDRDGDVAIFKLSADPDVAMRKVKGEYLPQAEIKSEGSGITSSPVYANGVLYVATGGNLWAIATATPVRARKPRSRLQRKK